MDKKVPYMLVLVLGVLAFYATLYTVAVSLWANEFHFQYYTSSMTPQGIYNTIVVFVATMLIARAAGALFERLGRRGYSVRFAVVASVTFLAFVHHWTQPVVKFLSFRDQALPSWSYNIFSMAPWESQWYVDSGEVIALALASAVLFFAEFVRRSLDSASATKASSLMAEPAGDSI